MVYNDAKLYAKTCKIPLDLAQERCNTFLGLLAKAKEETCPTCGAGYDSMEFDTDVTDYNLTSWVACYSCETNHSIEDKRLLYFITWATMFDDLNYLGALGKAGETTYIGTTWEDYVTETTRLLNESVDDVRKAEEEHKMSIQDNG